MVIIFFYFYCFKIFYISKIVTHTLENDVRNNTFFVNNTHAMFSALCAVIFFCRKSLFIIRDWVWPSGKALGRYAEGPQVDSASALPSLQKCFGLWTLSCDFVPHN